jgi:hypothetical protein
MAEPYRAYNQISEGVLRTVKKRSGWLEGAESEFAMHRLDFLPRSIIEWGVALIYAYFWNFMFLPKTVKRRLEDKV